MADNFSTQIGSEKVYAGLIYIYKTFCMSFFRFIAFLIFFSFSESLVLQAQDVKDPGPREDMIYTMLDSLYMCPDSIWVPVRVQNLVGIASISLRFTFDPSVVTYAGYYGNTHPGLFSGFLLVGNVPLNTITISWYSVTPFSILNDTLLSFRFYYAGGVSAFVWDTVICQYSNLPGDILPAVYVNGYVSSETYSAEIVSDPDDYGVCEGYDCYFAVDHLYGQSFSWEYSADNGLSWLPVPNAPPYSGADNDTLLITNVPLLFNNYLYRCTVYGACPPNPVSGAATLTVQAAPVADAGPDQSVCQGDTAVINGSAQFFGSILWLSSGTGTFLNATTVNPSYLPSAADVTAGMVTIRLMLEGLSPCGAVTDSMQLTIHALPIASAGNDTTICEGGVATLTGSGGNDYLWSTIPPSSNQVVNVSPSVNTTYHLTVSNFGCESYDSVKVFVQMGPVVSAGQDAAICANETLTLNGTASFTSSIQWSTVSGDGSFLNSNQLSTIYTPGPGDINNGSVFLVLSGVPVNPCADVARDTLELTLIPLPLANAGSDETICFGDSLTLTATGGTSFIWSTLPPANTASITISPASTTVFYVTVSNLQCFAVDSVKVIVLPLPDITLSEDTMICFGQSVTLVATGGLTYAWSSGHITSTVDVSPVVDTWYSVTITGLNGCQRVDSVLVTVNADLTCSVVPPGPAFCNGGSVTLTASANQTCTFSWSPPEGLSSVVGPVVIASPAITSTYEVVATDNMGCTASSKVNITVYQNPMVEVQPPFYNLCLGDTLTLTAYGASTYFWTPPTGLSANNLPVVMASPKKTTVYQVTGTDIHNCKTTVPVVINVLPVPVVDLPGSVYIYQGESYLLDGNGHIDSCTYLWQDATTNSYYYASEPGWYYVTVDRNGCIVTDTTWIRACSELWVPNAFSPNNDGVNDIFLIGHTEDLVEFELTIYNRWGEQVYYSTNPYEGWDGSYEGNRCPVGVYHYVVEYLGQCNVLLEKEGKKHGQITLFR